MLYCVISKLRRRERLGKAQRASSSRMEQDQEYAATLALFLRFQRSISTAEDLQNLRDDSGLALTPGLSKTAPMSTLEIRYPSPNTVPDLGSGIRKKKTLFGRKKQKNAIHELINAACNASCSNILQRSLKSEGMNLIYTDPAVVDFLLVCASCERNSQSIKPLKYLPGKCPVGERELKGLVDEMPALVGNAARELSGTSTTPASSKEDLISGLNTTHLELLRYLLTSSFAHLTSLSATHHPSHAIPTLRVGSSPPWFPHTFLLLKQPKNKEALFRAHAARQNHTTATVFHGTHPCRLPRILSQGLRNMSGTRYQSNGRMHGRGIYLATKSSEAMRYARVVEPWKKSRWSIEPHPNEPGTLRNGMKVLLGCEVVVPVENKLASGCVFVEKDAGRVIVRFVWVLPKSVSTFDNMFEGNVDKAMEALRKMRGD